MRFLFNDWIWRVVAIGKVAYPLHLTSFWAKGRENGLYIIKSNKMDRGSFSHAGKRPSLDDFELGPSAEAPSSSAKLAPSESVTGGAPGAASLDKQLSAFSLTSSSTDTQQAQQKNGLKSNIDRNSTSLGEDRVTVGFFPFQGRF